MVCGWVTACPDQSWGTPGPSVSGLHRQQRRQSSPESCGRRLPRTGEKETVQPIITYNNLLYRHLKTHTVWTGAHAHTSWLTWMRVSTLSCTMAGGLFFGRIVLTRTPSTKSWLDTRTWKRWPQFLTQVSRTFKGNEALAVAFSAHMLALLVLGTCACSACVLKPVFSTQLYSRVSQSRERALTTHRQSQHNFMEVLIPYNSLLNGSKGIFGPEGEMR